MQYLTLAAAAALVATARASADTTSFNLNSTCDEASPLARVHNRCSYPIYLWSVLQGTGCPSGGGAVLQPGEIYQENYRPAVNGIGTSIKMSSTESCDPSKLFQLEYYINDAGQYAANYLDASYVNCAGGCPTRDEGFYLQSGNQDGQYASSGDNTVCPILSCSDPSTCDKVAYVNPDDVQTKSCNVAANLLFYACGGEAPGSESESPAPASSKAAASSSQAAAPSSKKQHGGKPAASSAAAAYTPTAAEVQAAAITSAPVEAQAAYNVKTEVVYVTVDQYQKRHAHGHRHQHFRA